MAAVKGETEMESNNKNQPRMGDTANENIARQQETKVAQHRTGAGETSTTQGVSNREPEEAHGQGGTNRDVETGRSHREQ
jgi:hypothetical protein